MRATPRNTIRLRLTLLYTVLFLISGAALLVLIYVLVDRGGAPVLMLSHVLLGQGSGTPQPAASPPGGLPAIGRELHAQEMRTLLVNSLIALAAMAVLSGACGWIAAGRVLRPLRVVTASVREITANRLDERLLVEGPRDELAELSETFNDLLDRLEAAFRAERLFVANASHELRTPLTRERTVMEVALRDRNATVESLRTAGERVLASGEQLERLIEALLTLARSQRGVEAHDPFDLAEAAEAAVTATESAAVAAGLKVRADLRTAPGRGDPRLIERLVANLVDNAIRHNVAGGTVEVSTWSESGVSHVRVANTGPQIPAGDLHRLVHPFQRLAPGRASHTGSGLGLSIVHAIALAHGAQCLLTALPEGGLTAEVCFPRPDPPPAPSPTPRSRAWGRGRARPL